MMMNKETAIKMLNDLREQGKQPHGRLRDLLIEMMMDEEG